MNINFISLHYLIYYDVQKLYVILVQIIQSRIETIKCRDLIVELGIPKSSIHGHHE